MFLENNPPMIYTPTSVIELLNIYKKNPQALLFAGGTWTLSHQKDKIFHLGKAVINMGKLTELKKISRSERYLEFGSGVTLADILNLKTSIIHPILYHAIQSMATPQIQNQATIGGNLCVKDHRMSLFPALSVLNAQIELREIGKSRWVEIRHFINENNEPDIRPNELLTRIRIPIEDYEFQVNKSIGFKLSAGKDFAGCTAVAKLHKEVVLELRVRIMDGKWHQFRPFQTESHIVGKKIPFSEKDKIFFNETFAKEYTNQQNQPTETAKERVKRLFHWLINELSNFYSN